jgi:nucleoside-diphosphate-sugar epimerase
MSTVLVTGAAGRIGATVGWTVVGTDRRELPGDLTGARADRTGARADRTDPGADAEDYAPEILRAGAPDWFGDDEPALVGGPFCTPDTRR